MEEKNNMNQNNQSKKMPGELKRILATAACLTILLGGGNIYASTQGYDNIFFLIIEKLGITTDVFGKEEILTDRDITISYRPIEIAKGTQIQINNLVIKDNQAKLKIQVNESNTESSITPFIYRVKDENEVELCNYTSANLNIKEYKEEIILNDFKEETKKLFLEIYNINNQKIVDLEINLENKEINVIGQAEEVTKISEEELKQYLGAFAMLNYNGTEYNINMTENEKKTMVALLIAESKGTNIDVGLYMKNNTDVRRVLDKEKIHAFIESFTDIELNNNEVMDFSNSNIFNTLTFEEKVQYIYELDEIGCSPTVLEVTNIDYIGGIYNVTFRFCYSTTENKGFEAEKTVEDLAIYEMSIGLILDEANEYSKYRVSSMSEVILIEEGKNLDDSIDLTDKVPYINFDYYVGKVWQITAEDGKLEELVISKISENTVTFSYYEYRNKKYENIMATLQGNTAEFKIEETNGMKLYGEISLENGAIGEKDNSEKEPQNYIKLTLQEINGENTSIKEKIFIQNFEYDDFIGGVWVYKGENGEKFEIIISDINNDEITCELLSYRNVSYGKQTAKFGWDSISRAYFEFSDGKTGKDRQYVDIGLILDTKGLRLYTQDSSDNNLKAYTTYNELKHLKYEDFIRTWRKSEENIELNVLKMDKTGIEFELIIDGKSYGVYNEKFGFESAAFTQSCIKDAQGKEVLTIYMDFRGNGVELNIISSEDNKIKSGIYNLQAK